MVSFNDPFAIARGTKRINEVAIARSRLYPQVGFCHTADTTNTTIEDAGWGGRGLGQCYMQQTIGGRDARELI